MSFGDKYKKMGWTIVTLNPSKALLFNFATVPTEMHTFLLSIASSDWVSTSFRTIAFKHKNDALIFKLSFG